MDDAYNNINRYSEEDYKAYLIILHSEMNVMDNM